MGKLVIVESPAKAKTIAKILGEGYDVQASVGHVRDLPERADDVPDEFKKQKWAKLGVNVEQGFAPLYIVPADKKRHVDNLKRAARGVQEILLATDEDREGESISWHVLQVLRPSSKQRVRRIVFHELTPEAIQEAVRNPREVDEDLVRAQETRRILDRLVGYSISPVLWKKVAPKLSAGRVQSVAVRLVVVRERERRRFVAAEYWDLAAQFLAANGSFKARLIRLDDRRLVTGKSFSSADGQPTDQKELWLKREDATALADQARRTRPYTVARLEAKPGVENPPPPFQTSSLQQEASRKLGFNARRTMQVAQALYEGVDLDGERVGLITYMRTDSLTLAERALTQAREVIRDLYGPEYLPAQPVRYKTKARNAQEAHEAIRPTDLSRRPQDVARYLDRDGLALYELIWKRTLACQMKQAQVERTSVEVAAKIEGRAATFSASGKRIVFPGFLRAYVEGSDDPEADLEGRESILPAMKVGDVLELGDILADEHHTQPPARYTEASLIRKLEEEGIGRPSTYASIMGTIQERGYVFKRGQELVPTLTAIAVTELLENHFPELVDLAFTAKMEAELDEIAEGARGWVDYLTVFYLGSPQHVGLTRQIEEQTERIPYPAIPVGIDPETELPIVAKVGRYGPFLQRGEGGPGNTAPIPDDLPPAELTQEKAIELLARKASGPEAIGIDPATGRRVFFRSGRFGSYLELEQMEEEKAAGEKPRRVSMPPGLKPEGLSEDDLALLLAFPRELGPHPETAEPITVQIGRYGVYVKAGAESRTVEDWRAAAQMTLEGALNLLSQPKARRGRGVAAAAPAAALREFGKLEGAEGPVRLLAGRYGPYVTDGKTNATIPKGTVPEAVTPEMAIELIRARQGAPKKTGRRQAPRRRSA
jgi:DNA topoisomerase-1